MEQTIKHIDLGDRIRINIDPNIQEPYIPGFSLGYKYIEFTLDGIHYDTGSESIELDIKNAIVGRDINKEEKYYQVIGYYTDTVIGWTIGEEGKKDVLKEEPLATFKEISYEQYKLEIDNG